MDGSVIFILIVLGVLVVGVVSSMIGRHKNGNADKNK